MCFHIHVTPSNYLEMGTTPFSATEQNKPIHSSFHTKPREELREKDKIHSAGLSQAHAYPGNRNSINHLNSPLFSTNLIS